MKWGGLLAALLFSSPTISSANDNLTCFGLSDVFGTLTGQLETSGKSGPLDISKVAKMMPGAISAETKNHELQRLSYLAKSQVIPSAEGGYRTLDLRTDVDLAYKNGQLSRLAQKSYEDGKTDAVLAGKETSFDWKGGQCRPTKITVRDQRQLGTKKGIVFDSELCSRLTSGEKGVSVKRAEACVDAGKKALTILKDYDQELRAGNELLVTANPFQPGSLLPATQVPDTSQALSLMASCAAYERSAGSSAKPIKASAITDDPANDGSSAR